MDTYVQTITTLAYYKFLFPHSTAWEETELPWKNPAKIYAADYLCADSNAWPQVEPKCPSSTVSTKEKKYISKQSISKYQKQWHAAVAIVSIILNTEI